MKKVYDIINAGPNHRFMIRGKTGTPLIVSNCVQSLARDIMAEMTLDINQEYWVAGLVHDEVITVVPETQAEDAKAYIQQAMSKSPVWAPDLPLACEVGIGERYGDAK